MNIYHPVITSQNKTQTPPTLYFVTEQKKGNIMTHTILLIDDLAELLRTSKSNVYKLKKQGKLPIPLSMPGKLRWLASDIEAFLQSRAPPPVNAPTATKQRKKQEQKYRERQQRAEQTLQRHKLNRNTRSATAPKISTRKEVPMT
jgi:predicted DNA-binding transcriptional regulator AlpA